MEDKNYSFEFCNTCREQVLTNTNIELQTCSKCGRPLTPCSVCKANPKTVPNWDGCKRSCPFKEAYDKAFIEWEKKNNS